MVDILETLLHLEAILLVEYFEAQLHFGPSLGGLHLDISLGGLYFGIGLLEELLFEGLAKFLEAWTMR